MQFKILFTTALAALAVADPPAISWGHVQHQLDGIELRAEKLGDAIGNFSGSYLSAMKIFKECGHVIKFAAKASQPPLVTTHKRPTKELTDNTFAAADRLAAQVKRICHGAVIAKHKIGIFRIFAVPQGRKLLKGARAAGQAFSKVLIENSFEKRSRIVRIANEVDDAFKKAIEAYEN